jgi:hypothetical protein
MIYDIELDITEYNNEELKKIIGLNGEFSIEDLNERINCLLLDVEKNNILSNVKKQKIKTFLKESETKLTMEYLKNYCVKNEVIEKVILKQELLEKRMDKIITLVKTLINK